MATFEEIINVPKPVLVDFFAAWCGPCQALAPVLEQIKNELGDGVSVIKIDVDKNRQLASQYGVRGVPTMILFKNRQIIWRQSGVVPKDAIIQIIKTNS